MREPSSRTQRHRMLECPLLLVLALMVLAMASSKARADGHANVRESNIGSVDSQHELQEMFDHAARTTRRVVLPAGTFRHSGLLVLRDIQVTGAGDSTVLLGTTRDQASILLTGEDTSLSHLQVGFPATTRSVADTSALVLVHDAKGFRVENLDLDGSDSVGIFVTGSSNGRIEGNRIRNTLADAIHVTGGSSDILIRDNVTQFSGDDGIAVVSYEKNGRLVERVTITHNAVLDNRSARGISVVGGADVEVLENRIRCRAGYAGVYVASESAFRTYGSRAVNVRRNTIQGCGGSRVGHGAITIFSDYNANERISVVANRISDSPSAGIQVLWGPNINLTLKDNVIVNSRDAAIKLYHQSQPLVVSGNTSDGGVPATLGLFSTASSLLRKEGSGE